MDADPRFISAAPLTIGQQRRTMLDALDEQRLDHHRLVRLVLSIARDLGDFFYDILAFHDFTEDGVLAGEPIGGSNGDEELRSIRIRACIGHGQLAGNIELVWRALGFVFEFVAGAAHAGAGRISALDHEIGNDTVKEGAVVELVLALFVRDGMAPLTAAFGELDEICDGFRCFLFKEHGHDLALAGIEYGVGSGLTGHLELLLFGHRQHYIQQPAAIAL